MNRTEQNILVVAVVGRIVVLAGLIDLVRFA